MNGVDPPVQEIPPPDVLKATMLLSSLGAPPGPSNTIPPPVFPAGTVVFTTVRWGPMTLVLESQAAPPVDIDIPAPCALFFMSTLKPMSMDSGVAPAP